MFAKQWWLLLAVALVLNSVGFKKYVWFKTIGYGLSVGGMALCVAVMSIVRGCCTPGFMILCLILMVYGLRLGCAQLLRERRVFLLNKKVIDDNKKEMSMSASVILWIGDSFLYLALLAPLLYRISTEMATGPEKSFDDAGTYIGMCIAGVGVVIEIMAEYQKYEQKKTKSSLPAMDGLYKMSKNPDYFGEILVWAGVFVSGIPVYEGLQWAVAIVGFVAIISMMINAAKRMEDSQEKVYGKKSEYVEYSDSTPVLIPLIPIYHLSRKKKK